VVQRGKLKDTLFSMHWPKIRGYMGRKNSGLIAESAGRVFLEQKRFIVRFISLREGDGHPRGIPLDSS